MTTSTRERTTAAGGNAQESEGRLLVSIRGLTKRYSDRIVAVDHVDLTVRRGEVYGFLGPNGAGKTTTLRMLLGLVRPTSGEVRVMGGQPGAPATLARMGALIESPGCYPHLSGYDNLRVFARYAGVGRDRVAAALAAVDLTDRARDRFGTYSLGMKQRLGVAVALLGDPELLVLDEPTNGLDPAGMADMRALIRRLGAEGRTVVLSSHLLGEVQQICDRVGVIHRGRIVTESTVDELRGEAALLVAAQPIDRARQVAAGLLGADRVAVAGDTLRLTAPATAAAAVNRALVTAGVDVTELRPVERTLEEVFFEMTGDQAADRTTKEHR